MAASAQHGPVTIIETHIVRNMNILLSWSPIFLFPSQTVTYVAVCPFSPNSLVLFILSNTFGAVDNYERRDVFNFRLPCRASLCCTTHPPPPRVGPQGSGRLGCETESSFWTPSLSLASLVLALEGF